jgi:hypothetical protein
MKYLKTYMFAALCSTAVMSCDKNERLEGESNTRNQVASGLGGSMAQFTIMNNYLYSVDYKSLKVFLISDPTNPQLLENIDLGVGIETIYPQNDHLFIGTQNGVLIYDVTNPRNPTEVSQIRHVTSCDPVVANDQYAIATLRGGTPCNGSLNRFDIMDISNLDFPTLIMSTDLINPYGLGFVAEDEDLVFICDGYAGLKIFDISDVGNIHVVMHREDLEAIDVISAADNLLVVLTRQGVYQFDSTNPLELVERSFISVQ